MNTATKHPLTEVLERAKITLIVTSRPTSPTLGTDWKHYAWEVKLCRNKDMHPQDVSKSIPYKCGLAHVTANKGPFPSLPTPPRVEDVIISLTLDSSACDESFGDWCSNFGYDTDSRKALDVYLMCQEGGKLLRSFLKSDYKAVTEAARDY